MAAPAARRKMQIRRRAQHSAAVGAKPPACARSLNSAHKHADTAQIHAARSQAPELRPPQNPLRR